MDASVYRIVYFFCQRCVIHIRTSYNNWGVLPQHITCPVCSRETLAPVPRLNPGTVIDHDYQWFRPGSLEGIHVDDEIRQFVHNGGLFLMPYFNDQPLSHDAFNALHEVLSPQLRRLADIDVEQVLQALNAAESDAMSSAPAAAAP